jgi:hypothetical protein
MGFRLSAGILDWLAVAGIHMLFTLALTWVAAIAGLLAKSVDGASAFSCPIIFLPFISSEAVLNEEARPSTESVLGLFYLMIRFLQLHAEPKAKDRFNSEQKNCFTEAIF